MLLFIINTIFAQNSSDIKKIDSLTEAISVKAAKKKHKVVNGTLLKEANRTSSIRFHLDSNKTEMIVVESNLRDNVTLYYFNDGKLIYVANFVNGDYNAIANSYYFTDGFAFKKGNSGFEQINPRIFNTQVEAYFDIYKEQLKAK